MLADSIGWRCWLAVLTGGVDRRCWLAVLDGGVGWRWLVNQYFIVYKYISISIYIGINICHYLGFDSTYIFDKWKTKLYLFAELQYFNVIRSYRQKNKVAGFCLFFAQILYIQR